MTLAGVAFRARLEAALSRRRRQRRRPGPRQDPDDVEVRLRRRGGVGSLACIGKASGQSTPNRPDRGCIRRPPQDDTRTRAGADDPVAVHVDVARTQQAFLAGIIGKIFHRPKRQKPGEPLGRPSREAIPAFPGVGGEDGLPLRRAQAVGVEPLGRPVAPAKADPVAAEHLGAHACGQADALDGHELLMIRVRGDGQPPHARLVQRRQAIADGLSVGGPEGVGLDRLQRAKALPAGAPRQLRQRRPALEGLAAADVDPAAVGRGRLKARPKVQSGIHGHVAPSRRGAAHVATGTSGVAPIRQQETGERPMLHRHRPGLVDSSHARIVPVAKAGNRW